jgi:hypothetical protein
LPRVWFDAHEDAHGNVEIVAHRDRKSRPVCEKKNVAALSYLNRGLQLA